MNYSKAIVEGIATQIYKATGYPVYINNQEQNMMFPSFFVEMEHGEHTQKLGNRYYREANFYIHFFQSENGEVQDYSQVEDVAEKLTWALEFIGVNGDKLNGVDMSWKMVDDVMQFKVKYRYFLGKVETKEPMEKLIQEQGVKGNGRQ